MRKQIQYKKILSFITVCLLYGYSSCAQVMGTPYVALSNYLITFNYTGAQQTWTVPTGVTSIKVSVSGAQGGGNSAANGKGGLVTATLSVTPGQVLAIVVGGQPTSNTTVYGYGGAGGVVTTATTRNGYAGGGLSGLFLSSVSFANALVVAGGGGGTNGLNSLATTGVPPGGGGAAGAPNGSNGAQGNWGGRQEGGRGATQSAGGAIGVGVDTPSTAPGIGNQLSGGNGGSVSTSTWTGGGGGGAGYYGGGGGAGGGSSVGAGGGGSSYVKTTVGTNIVYTSGANTGHGKVVISY